MSRSTIARTTVAFAGVAGALALAGCSAIGSGAPDDSAGTETAGPSAAATSEPAASSSYADGTYTATGSYNTPAGVAEEVNVTIGLEDSTVASVKVAANPQADQSAEYQQQFIDGIADEVVGKNIDDLSVSRVGGSSLTSGGFNEAVEKIKSEAASAG